MKHRPILLALVVASSLSASPALAQSSPEDRAAADALYEEAGRLMAGERWAEACPKLEASLKLDPGIGTTLRLAQCFEKIGRTASAWSFYGDAEAMARRVGDKRADEAAKHAKRMEPLLSRLVLDVAPENRATGVEIRRDGKVLDPGAWASAMPLDPGPHVIEASAQGRRPWKTTITIEAKPGKTTVQVPPLEAAPAETIPSAPAPAPTWNARRIAGVTGIALGGAGVVVGAILGGLAAKKLGDAKSSGHCDQSWATCDATGMDMRNGAKGLAHGSTAGIVAGGAVLVAGIVLFATAPATSEAKSTGWVTVGPLAGVGVAGVVIRGGF